MNPEKTQVTELAELEHLYGAVAKPSLTKVTSFIHPAYRHLLSYRRLSRWQHPARRG